ncbi:DUF4367 domain-containing protein [Desulfoscipio gibsoniae]
MAPKNDPDKLIAEAIQQTLNQAPEPDMERIWKNINRKIKRQNKMYRLTKITASVVLVLLAGIYFTINVPDVKATGLKTWQRLETIFMNNSGAAIPFRYVEKTNDPVQEKPATLEEIQKDCPFPIKKPGYLPNGYVLKEVNMENVSKTLIEVKQVFLRENKDHIVFIQMSITGEAVSGQGYDTDDTTVHEVLLNGKPALLLVREKDRTASISWDEGIMIYKISGILSPEEAVKMAESLE